LAAPRVAEFRLPKFPEAGLVGGLVEGMSKQPSWRILRIEGTRAHDALRLTPEALTKAASFATSPPRTSSAA